MEPYIILSAPSVKKLQEIVNDVKWNAYTPHGGPFTHGIAPNNPYIHQAMKLTPVFEPLKG